MDFNNFIWHIGDTIYKIQLIENDIKWIFSYMKKGNPHETFDKISKWTFGQTVSKLKELDHSDDDNLLSKDDYNYLKQMAEKRNHWAHKTFLEFVYIDEFLYSVAYKHECDLLLRDNERLTKLSNQIERIRLDFVKKHRR